jgi:N-acetylglucosaminyldiphosphoundecaprenol N-acetyl-beta-D-mannosaminyltransferase
MRINIADIPVDNVTIEEAIDKIKTFLHNRKPCFAVAINPEKVLKAKKDDELEEILKKSDLNFVDGIGIVLGSKILYKKKIKERIAGIDLFMSILRLSAKNKYRVYLLGAKEETIKKAVAEIKNTHPQIEIAGFHNGYFEDEEKVVTGIKNSDADILFVGMGSPKQEKFIYNNLDMGSPKQEKFIYNNLDRLNVKFAMGVGGSFNVLSGELKRAPQTVQKLGLEWFYRFILDPKRLPRILSLPKFIFLLTWYPERKKEEINFFNITISNRNMRNTLYIAEQFVKSGKFHLIVTLNGEMAGKVFKDKAFFDIVKKSDLVIPDGIGIVWGTRMQGKRILHRIPGVEFAWHLLEFANKKGYKIYLLGTKEEVLKKAVTNIKNCFPNSVTKTN